MSQASIFQYKNYKTYILDWMEKTPNGGRGQRKILAEAIGCQTPFITHVLAGEYHFSPEQAEAATRWMGLSEKEVEFFILLVMRDRAGTNTLRRMFDRQLDEAKSTEDNLSKKVKIQNTLDLAAQVTYYSNWLYAAVHMAVLVPQLRTADKLQKYFQVPTPQLIGVLDFLSNHKLIELTPQGYKSLQPMLFLPRESSLLPAHHTNWRMRAIEKSQIKDKHNLHYSLVMSLSTEAYDWIQERLIELIEESAEKIKPSADEKIGCLLLDLFEA